MKFVEFSYEIHYLNPLCHLFCDATCDHYHHRNLTRESDVIVEIMMTICIVM